MNELALPVAVLVLAVLATYFFCVRPMKRGSHCGLAPGRGRSGCAEEGADDTHAEVERLRQEVDALRGELGRLPSKPGSSVARPG